MEKIKEEKHHDLSYGVGEAIATLQKPDEVYQSIKDSTIALYRKKIGEDTLLVAVKHLNGDGFVVTVYQTTKVQKKGTKIWPM